MEPKKISGNRRRNRGNAIRICAEEALYKVFFPIAEFVLDAGLSVREAKSIFQNTSVKLLADRQIKNGKRHNISAISATTGVSRSEISRIIKMTAMKRRQLAEREQQPTNRVLSSWCSNSEFANSDGRPADLRIFGSGASFNSLAKRYGRGVPTRAILDELVRTGSVELVQPNTVRLKAEVAVNGALSLNSVNEFGEKSAELLIAMLRSARNSGGHRFVSSASGIVESEKSMHAFRRRIASSIVQLTAEGQDWFSNDDACRHPKIAAPPSHAVSLTVIYRDEPNLAEHPEQSTLRRRNLRRIP